MVGFIKCSFFWMLTKCNYMFLYLTYRMRQLDQLRCCFSYCGQDTTLCLLYPLCVDASALTSDQFITAKWDFRSRDPFITILPTQNLLHGICLFGSFVYATVENIFEKLYFGICIPHWWLLFKYVSDLKHFGSGRNQTYIYTYYSIHFISLKGFQWMNKLTKKFFG